MTSPADALGCKRRPHFTAGRPAVIVRVEPQDERAGFFDELAARDFVILAFVTITEMLDLRARPLIYVLLAALALMIRPNLAGAAELDLARGKITSDEYLRLLDKRSFCKRENTLSAIRSAVDLNRSLKRLYETVDLQKRSPENLCFRVKQASQYELEQIGEYRARATACRLRAKDLAPLLADHEDTAGLMKRVCSPAALGGPLPDILRFDEYKMPPFPE